MIQELTDYLINNKVVDPPFLTIGRLQGYLSAIDLITSMAPNVDGEPTDGECLEMVIDIIKMAKRDGVIS